MITGPYVTIASGENKSEVLFHSAEGISVDLSSVIESFVVSHIAGEEIKLQLTIRRVALDIATGYKQAAVKIIEDGNAISDQA